MSEKKEKMKLLSIEALMSSEESIVDVEPKQLLIDMPPVVPAKKSRYSEEAMSPSKRKKK